MNRKSDGVWEDIDESVDDELGEDYAKLAGLSAEEDLNETTGESMKKRLPWLIILLFLGMGVSTVVGAFEGVVAVLPVGTLVPIIFHKINVDPENEHLIQAAISELTKGKTIVTIAHRLATIEQADQIIVVDDGRVVQCGTHQELVKVPGKYRDFVDIRKRSEGWQLTG